MPERIPCKNPDCTNLILPDTAARNDGLCMPCVHAKAKRERDEYIRRNRRDLNEFEGITNSVDTLKVIHRPRKFDPLVNWIPHPTPTDQLYASLTADEAQRMAEFAEGLIGTEHHDQAEEICLCLAAFTEANLDGCLRRLLQQGTVLPSMPFHRAPPDVRDALLTMLDNESMLRRNHILLALAWIGDAVVVEQFHEWRRKPPTWSSTLYVPPHAYSRQAGWELTASGGRRDLYFSHCTHLEKAASNNLPGFRSTLERTDTCPCCGTTLTNLFDIDPAQCGLGRVGNWHNSITIATCENCTAYGTVFGVVDDNGHARWSPNNARPTYLPDSGDIVKLPNDVLQLGRQRSPLFAADQFLPTSYSQLGGHPTWIQDAEYPNCPECAETMMFLAQINREDIEDLAEGMYYGFICPTCRTTATSYQQT